MSFAAAERATTQPDATTDRAANALRQLRQNVALLERLCDMGSFSDQAGHFGSSWPGGGERPPIRYEDSWGGLRGPSDTQLLIYS